jgi:hypothetical protein
MGPSTQNRPAARSATMRKRASRGPRLWRAAARSCGRLEAVSSSTESSISGAPPPSRPPEGHGVVVAAYHGRLSRARLHGADLRWPSSKPRARRRRTTSPHSRKATWPTAPPNRSPGRTLALGRSDNCGLLAALCHRATGAALRLVGAPRTFVRPSLPPAPLARPARVRDLILLSECGRSRRLTH